MFDIFPLEIVEQILSYLNKTDIVTIFIALDKQYNILSDYFWKKVCLKEEFLKYDANQEWHECFRLGMNKCLGNYTQTSFAGFETIMHVYSKSLITQSKHGSSNLYNIYTLDCKNKFSLVQTIEGGIIQFRDELILIHRERGVFLYTYNFNTNIYELLNKTNLEFTGKILGFDKTYCVSYNDNQRGLNLYTFHSNRTHKNIQFPSDVKFLIPVRNILHSEEIVLSVLSIENAYKVKVYNIKRCLWTLDLVCFSSSGITNEPNIWFGSHFVGCCDVSYRSRGIYFGMFKIWDKEGKLLFQVDIQPSNKHYIRCFFKNNFLILTTSDNTISIGDSNGHFTSKIQTSTSFIDIKLSTGKLLFIFLEDYKTVEIYDWTIQTHLYSITLKNKCFISMCSELMYCFYDLQYCTLEVINFFNEKKKN